MSSCGATKSITGGCTLTCNLDAGHALPHGVRVDGMPPFARWPVAWTEDDEQRRAERHGWRKGHVRRPYQTLAMWKAGR